MDGSQGGIILLFKRRIWFDVDVYLPAEDSKYAPLLVAMANRGTSPSSLPRETTHLVRMIGNDTVLIIESY